MAQYLYYKRKGPMLSLRCRLQLQQSLLLTTITATTAGCGLIVHRLCNILKLYVLLLLSFFLPFLDWTIRLQYLERFSIIAFLIRLLNCSRSPLLFIIPFPSSRQTPSCFVSFRIRFPLGSCCSPLPLLNIC